MEPIILYIYVLAGIAACLFVHKYFKFIFHPRLTSPVGPINGPIMRCLVLPFLLQRRRFWGPMTRLRAITHLLHITGTLVCNTIQVPGLATARSRAGSLAILHLFPLAMVPHLSIGADIFGISLDSYRQLHTSFGIMAVFQSVLHVILAVHDISFDIEKKHQRHGFIVS